MEVEAKTRPTSIPNSSPKHRISPPIDYHKRSYTKVVSKGSSSESSYSSGTNFLAINSLVSLENVIVLVRRFFTVIGKK